MKKILFICEGNVGRSQMAEAYYNMLVGFNVATSAGVKDVGVKYHYHPAQFIIEIMQEEGIDLSKNHVKVVTKQMIAIADKVIVLCNKKLCPTYLINSEKVIYIAMRDPYKKSKNLARQIRDEIKEVVYSLVEDEGVI